MLDVDDDGAVFWEVGVEVVGVFFAFCFRKSHEVFIGDGFAIYHVIYNIYFSNRVYGVKNI